MILNWGGRLGYAILTLTLSIASVHKVTADGCPPLPSPRESCTSARTYADVKSKIESAPSGSRTVFCPFMVRKYVAEDPILIETKIHVACQDPGQCVIYGGGAYVEVKGADAELVLQGLTMMRSTETAINVGRLTPKQQQICNCNFVQNYSDERGGAVYADRGTSLLVGDTTFYYNTAKIQGGAIQSYGDLVVSSSSFIKNEASSGGAIYSDASGTFTIQNSKFQKNVAFRGPAAFIEAGLDKFEDKGNNNFSDHEGCNNFYTEANNFPMCMGQTEGISNLTPNNMPVLTPAPKPKGKLTPPPKTPPTPKPFSPRTPRPAQRPTVDLVPRPTIVLLPPPTRRPVPLPTPRPVPRPTPQPSSRPTPRPVPQPTIVLLPPPTRRPILLPTPKPTPRPISTPTEEPTNSPTVLSFIDVAEPRNADLGYFNYDPQSRYGPEKWDKMSKASIRRTEEYQFWAKYQSFLREDLSENNCGKNGREESPVDVRDSKAECLEYHEIRHRPGDFRLDDIEVEMRILPNKLQIKWPERTGDEPDVPSADIPKGWGKLHDALKVDVFVPAQHRLNGKEYVAEYQIFHLHHGFKGAPVVTILMDIDPDNKMNRHFQIALDRWQEEFDVDQNACNARMRERERILWHATNKTSTATAGDGNDGGDRASIPIATDGANPQFQRELQTLFDHGDRSDPFTSKGRWDPYDEDIMTSIWFYAYEGSLVEPPCTPFITYLVMDKPMLISKEQLDQMKRLTFNHVDSRCRPTSNHYRGEARRPLQDLKGRDIWRCTCKNFLSDDERRDTGFYTCDDKEGGWVPPSEK